MHEDRKQEERKPTPKRRDGQSLSLLALELAGFIVVAVAIGLIVGSCGEKKEVPSGVATLSPPTTTAVPVAAVASHTPAQTPEGDEVASADSLPPEVTASVSDTLVTRGSAIEVTAQASVDATDLSLWDGLGKRQPFAYDERGKVWHAYYRVPLKSADRLGLSVTARSEAGRWRRVWLFLRVDRGTAAPSDSTK